MAMDDFSIDGGIAPIVPELFVLDFDASKKFWTETLGFQVVFERERYAYLRLGAVEIMIAQATRHWSTGPYQRPLGRGINFQIFVEDPDALAKRIVQGDWPLFEDVTEAWPASGGVARGYRQFLVQAPEGYLLRFAKKLGVRPSEKDSPPPTLPVTEEDKP
jgi:catechol 2,3-dioxygenase-like lactoylglutathione lyase family enzyme